MTSPVSMDALIDDVAAQLTGDVPGPDLRAGVLAGIDRVALRRRRASGTFAAAGLLAAAGLGLAVAVRLVPPSTFDLPALTAAPTSYLGTLAAGPYRVDALALPPPRVQAPTPPTTPALSPEEEAWMRRAIPPLPERGPIAIGDIQPDPLGTPLLELTPLATVPLAVAPIGVARQASRDRHD
jgi:hypothetical protein